MKNNNKFGEKPFTLGIVGKSEHGPYATHVEGFVTADPHYVEAKEGKQAYTRTGIGISGNALRLLAMSDGTYSKENDYPEMEFIQITVVGAKAKTFAEQVTKGSKIVVSGPLSKSEYTDKQNNARANVSILANTFSVLASSKGSGSLNSFFNAVTMIRADDEGQVQKYSTVCGLTGKVTKVSSLECAKTGTQYMRFQMSLAISADKVLALANGTYDKEAVYDKNRTLLTCTVFNKHAIGLSKILRPGMLVCCSGSVDSSEHDGVVYVNMRPIGVSVMQWGEQSRTETEEKKVSVDASSEDKQPETPVTGSSIAVSDPDEDDDESDDELPF